MIDKFKINVYIGILILSSVLYSCSVTKNLPENEVLYIGMKKTEVLNKDKSETGSTTLEEVDAALACKPNNAFMGSAFVRSPIPPVKLWAYNKYVNSTSKFGKWMFRKFAADPVLISGVNPELRAKIATNILHNYGYFQGSVSYEILPEKNPRKAKVRYIVDMQKPYFIDSVMYEGFPLKADSIIHANKRDMLLHRGENFNVVQLEAERSRISSLLRDNGYYYYRPEYIVYLADTIQNPGNASLKIKPVAGLLPEVNKQYVIGNLRLNMYDTQRQRSFENSIERPGISINYNGDKIPLRPVVLFNNFRFRKGELYSATKQQYTQENINSMGLFSSVEFQYTPRDSVGKQPVLDVDINTRFDQLLDGELELDFKSKSNDQLGPGASFGISKRNAFRGGETLSLNLNGSYEWQTGSSVEGKSSVINSYSYGISMSLVYPRLVIPFYRSRWSPFPRSSQFKIYLEKLNRAGYYKMLSFGGTATYTFQTSRKSRHTLTPLRLTFNVLQSTTARFDSIRDANQALYVSMQNQFIPALSYTYTRDDTNIKQRHHTWWETSITSSGNVTSMVYALLGQSFKEKNKNLLGNPFAQFVKFTTELRKTFTVGEDMKLATRVFGGIIYAYGNSSVAPYSEQFYIGGANSIRAFTVRSIGPGTYRPKEGNMYSYIDQTGDIKLEANVEFRFPILGDIHGALFLDAGNIWLLHDDEQRPGAKFTLSDFGKQIALGTGVGLRYDLDFLVFRLDLGVALHAPYETSKKGYYNIPKFADGLGLHFAIGYPF